MRDNEPQGSAPVTARSSHPNGFSSLRKLLQKVSLSHSDLYLAGSWRMVTQELAGDTEGLREGSAGTHGPPGFCRSMRYTSERGPWVALSQTTPCAYTLRRPQDDFSQAHR